MTIIWPATLPAAPLVEGFQEAAPVTAIRTEMDQGPAKLRRRTTAGVGKMTVRYLLSRAQVDDLEEFFSDTTAGGTLSFSLTHPRTQQSVTCRFIEPPQYATTNGNYFTASLMLEVLP